MNKLLISPSPHVHSGDSIEKNMYGVLIALIPAFICSVLFFGMGAIIVTLTSVIENPANKYTLVDFWASWCGPCMGEVPHLKKTYDEFRKKGFEIYGVSFDEDRGDWLGAVEQNDMNWLHVSEVKGFDNQAAKDYAIQGIPSNFLIDGQGTIVAKNLRGEALYEKISELLAQ